MMYVCEEHRDCKVVHDTRNCPVCDLKTDHGNLEDALADAKDEIAGLVSDINKAEKQQNEHVCEVKP